MTKPVEFQIFMTQMIDAFFVNFRFHARRLGPLGSIILLHIAFFYALQSGLLRQAVQAVPKEVFATFITPEPASHPPKPQPDAVMPMPAAKKTVTAPPVAPAMNAMPSQPAISVPSIAPQSVEPAAVVAPPAPAAPAQPRTISSGVEYLRAPQPEYPIIAKRMGDEGKVMLRVFVNEKGRPEQVDLLKSSGFPLLDEAARQAVLRSVFKPHNEDGKAVAVYAIVPINFQLNP